MKKSLPLHSVVLAMGMLVFSAMSSEAKNKDAFVGLTQNPSLTLLTDFILSGDGKDTSPLVIVSSSSLMGETFAELVQTHLTEKGYSIRRSIQVGGGFGVARRVKATVIQNPDEKYFDTKTEKDRHGAQIDVYVIDKSKISEPPYYTNPAAPIADELKEAVHILFSLAVAGEKVDMTRIVSALSIAPDGYALLISAQAKPGSVSGKIAGAMLGGLVGMAISSALKPGIQMQAKLIDVSSGDVVWSDKAHSDDNPTREIFMHMMKGLLSPIPSRSN